MTFEELKYRTKPVFDKYRIKYAGVFGSFARGEEKKGIIPKNRGFLYHPL